MTDDPIRHVLDNPYLRSGAIVASIFTNMATVLWSFLVLWFRDSVLIGMDRYSWIAVFIDEQRIAVLFFALGAIQMAWVIFKLPPWSPSWWRWPSRFPLGSLGYAAMAGWWIFVAVNATALMGQLQPAVFALATTVATLGLYAVPHTG